MKLAQLMQNKKFKGFLTMLYSLGASVVVLGALFKIQHWPGAGFMLSAGLITEALIFFIYAFEKDGDTAPENENITTGVTGGNGFHSDYGVTAGEPGTGFPALLKFDRMLEETDITPDMLFRLGEGMRKLGETTENMSAMVDISAASTKYLNTIKRADESLVKTAKSYETVISNVTVKTVFKYKSISNSLSNIESGSIEFQQQMKSLNKNLSSLNNTFRLQQKSSEDFLKDQEACAAESRKYREQMKKLNENLTALNQVYSNMLSAMDGRKN